MQRNWRRLVAQARRQHGVITRGQAMALGIASSSFHARISAEGWSTPFAGVAVAPWAPGDARTRASAAGWAAAPRGGVTADTALALHGARVPYPAAPRVVVPHDGRGSPRAGSDVVRSRTLRPDDLLLVDGVPAVSVPRAVVDLAARASIETLRERLIDLRQQRLIDLDVVASGVERARGSTGLPRLRQAIRDVSTTGADSVLTRAVEEMLIAQGLRPDPSPVTVRVRGGRSLHPDITFASARVAIECDSLAFHADQRALDLDSRKHNAYRLGGWLVLRVTWRRLHRDRGGFLVEVRHALREHDPRSGITTPS